MPIIVHHPLYSGYVYDLEVEEDHSFFAEGIAVHNCTSISVVKGFSRDVTNGVDWFNGLPEDRQRTIAGDSAYELLASGKATLADFVHHHDDPIFGPMINEASVKGVLARK